MTRLSRCALRVGALVLCIFFFNLSALRVKLLQARRRGSAVVPLLYTPAERLRLSSLQARLQFSDNETFCRDLVVGPALSTSAQMHRIEQGRIELNSSKCWQVGEKIEPENDNDPMWSAFETCKEWADGLRQHIFADMEQRESCLQAIEAVPLRFISGVTCDCRMETCTCRGQEHASLHAFDENVEQEFHMFDQRSQLQHVSQQDKQGVEAEPQLRAVVMSAVHNSQRWQALLSTLGHIPLGLHTNLPIVTSIGKELIIPTHGLHDACLTVHMGRRRSYSANLLQHLMMSAIGIKHGWPHLLLLEDDVVPTSPAPQIDDNADVSDVQHFIRPVHGSSTSVQELVAEAPDDYDMIVVGSCSGISNGEDGDNGDPDVEKVSEHLVRQKGVFSRCANSYVLSAKGMQKLLMQLPAYAHIDHTFNAVGRIGALSVEHNWNTLLAAPPLLDEGSKAGNTTSSMDAIETSASERLMNVPKLGPEPWNNSNAVFDDAELDMTVVVDPTMRLAAESALKDRLSGFESAMDRPLDADGNRKDVGRHLLFTS